MVLSDNSINNKKLSEEIKESINQIEDLIWKND